jgi:hypothetical protein
MQPGVWSFLTLLAIAVAFVLAARMWKSPARATAWLGVMSLVALAFVFLGMAMLGMPLGVLVDDDNMYDLPRLQLTTWSILILSAYLTAAMSNVMSSFSAPAAGDGSANALLIAIPSSVWVLLGIHVTSWVGSPLVLSNKKMQQPEPAKVASTIQALNATSTPSPATVAQFQARDARRSVAAVAAGHPPVVPTAPEVFTNSGKIVTKVNRHDASLDDFFRGEEVGNASLVDLGKVQLFFFTVIVGFVYAVSLYASFRADGPVRAFPQLDSSIVALLGISNAGFIANMAIPHS